MAMTFNKGRSIISAIAFAVATLAALISVIFLVGDSLASRSLHAQTRQGAGIPFNCIVTTSTATTITAVGGPCTYANRNDNNALYITDIFVGSNANAIGADAFPTLKYGTGTTCGTGTTVIWGALTALTNLVQDQMLSTPIRVPAGSDLCWISSTAGSKFWVINGYLQP